MTPEEKQQLVYKFSKIISSAIYSNMYRFAGLSDTPWDFDTIYPYVQAEVDGYGNFGGTINWRHDGQLLKLFRWEDINLSQSESSDPIKYNMWGFAVTPVFLPTRPKFFFARGVLWARQSWWRFYAIAMKKMLAGITQKAENVQEDVSRTIVE